GILVSVGAALAAGSRLALSERFTPGTFVADARRVGASVVFYAGEMLRPLLFERPGRGDRNLPIRIFAGSGIRADLAARLHERFGAGVIEFYAGTAHKIILANATGQKPGALGRVLPGSAEVALIEVDRATKRPIRGDDGFFVRTPRGKEGLLVARVGSDEEDRALPGVVEGAFASDDRWFVSTDVLREDEDGDYWFVDSLGSFALLDGQPVSVRRVEDALYSLPEVELAAVVPTVSNGVTGLAAAFTSPAPIARARIDEALAVLAPHERPSLVRQVDEIPMTDGFRPRKAEVARALGRVPVPAYSSPKPWSATS
ncbi:MAG TPA: hypothetical protein VGI39_18570, partial [Polyangiaceae bacterium]